MTPGLARPQETRICVCGRAYPMNRPDRKFCSTICAVQARPTQSHSNPLKALFQNQRRQRRASLREVEQEIGLWRFALREWLSKPDYLFTTANLERLTTWLHQGLSTFTLEQAVQLQGGTGDERTGAHAAAAHAAHLERLQKNPKYRRAYARTMSAALKGRRHTEEARAKMSAAVRRARGRPDAKIPETLSATARGRASSMRVALRRHHPDLTSEQIEALAVERLQRPPYGFSRDMARGFFQPLPPREEARGRRRDAARCAEFQQLAELRGWDGLGRTPHRFYVVLAERFGDGSTPNTSRAWHVQHFPTCRSCLLALAGRAKKTTGNSGSGAMCPDPELPA